MQQQGCAGALRLVELHWPAAAVCSILAPGCLHRTPATIHHALLPLPQVFLCGQSCGAHLASLALLTQAEQRAKGAALPGGQPAWDTTRLRAFIGVSGVYNVYDLEDHLDRWGRVLCV